MDLGLIEQRHPALAELLRRWTAVDGRSDALTVAQLGAAAASSVRITPGAGGSGLVLADSGAAVNAIYGAVLDGLSADLLTPGRSDAADEAIMAMESRRPVLMEDGEPGARRARLYLPLAEVDGSVASVLCGVVELHPGP